MKNILLFLFIFLSMSVFAQTKITAENYYDFYSENQKAKLHSKSITTVWLNKLEAALILKEEMEKAGLKGISTFTILEIKENQPIVSICYSEDSKFGFVYESIHYSTPVKAHRDIKSVYKKMVKKEYSEKIVKVGNESKFLSFDELPNNLYIIKEDVYWYQYSYDERDNELLVSKEIMENILREDIRKVLKDVKK